VEDSLNLAVPAESTEDLYENAPCGFISTRPGGLIVRANETFLRWSSYQREDLIGRKRFHELLTVGGRIYYETHIAPLLQMQDKAREIAVEIVCADRRRLPVLISAVMRRDAAGDPQIISIAIVDATSRRKYEEELLQARQRAEYADHAKARFIALVSHEIRSPLNAIMAARHLLEKTELTEQQQRIVRMLRSSSESLLSLIENILDAGKLEAGKEMLNE
jgi:PAS domain S-box-containing protein